MSHPHSQSSKCSSEKLKVTTYTSNSSHDTLVVKSKGSFKEQVSLHKEVLCEMVGERQKAKALKPIWRSLLCETLRELSLPGHAHALSCGLQAAVKARTARKCQGRAVCFSHSKTVPCSSENDWEAFREPVRRLMQCIR